MTKKMKTMMYVQNELIGGKNHNTIFFLSVLVLQEAGGEGGDYDEDDGSDEDYDDDDDGENGEEDEGI